MVKKINNNYIPFKNSKSNYLCYGDLIFIRNDQKPYKYLGARSIYEENMYLIE